MLEQKVKLIYCGVGNQKLDQFAVNVGIHYGMQFPAKSTPKFPVYFADQNWKKPNKEAYINWVAEYKPKIATVLDLERESQFDEVLSWADSISKHVDKIVIIPKLSGIVSKIPQEVNGKEVLLGYSIPTSHGGTDVPVEEFIGWRVHLLGGNPQKQLNMYDKMESLGIGVYSVDCNYISMKANNFCSVWTRKIIKNRQWMDLQDIVGRKIEDGVYTAFSLSCVSLVFAWHERLNGLYYDI